MRDNEGNFKLFAVTYKKNLLRMNTKAPFAPTSVMKQKKQRLIILAPGQISGSNPGEYSQNFLHTSYVDFFCIFCIRAVFMCVIVSFN
jgi:hypothetical protein